MLRVWRGLLGRVLAEDRTLVALPRGVERCRVFRNVMTMEEEDLIYAEYGRVLDREGQQVALEGTSKEDRVIKHTYLEIHGDKDFTEVRSVNKKEIKRLPGLTWSPTLMKIIREVDASIIPFAPDTGRILEHNLPGYELHVENPTVGSSFLYFNLLCDTVLEFDDESTHRSGQVYLPARSLMCVSDEARWGFRFGERNEEVHRFRLPSGGTRRVEMDMRLSVQLWRFNVNLVDTRILQDRLDQSLVEAEKRLAAEEEKRLQQRAHDHERTIDEQEAMEALQGPDANRFNIQPDTPRASPTATLEAFLKSQSMDHKIGGGKLGGDLVEEDGPGLGSQAASLREKSGMQQRQVVAEMGQDYGRYKQQFSHVHNVLEEMKAMSDAGQPVNDMWLKKKTMENPQVDPERDAADGFDAEDIEGTWDRADAKARFYKAKLKTMDYDGTAFLNPTMPDVSKEAPLDMRSTIRKMAPHVKDGDKILAALPGGNGN